MPEAGMLLCELHHHLGDKEVEEVELLEPGLSCTSSTQCKVKWFYIDMGIFSLKVTGLTILSTGNSLMNLGASSIGRGCVMIHEGKEGGASSKRGLPAPMTETLSGCKRSHLF